MRSRSGVSRDRGTVAGHSKLLDLVGVRLIKLRKELVALWKKVGKFGWGVILTEIFSEVKENIFQAGSQRTGTPTPQGQNYIRNGLGECPTQAA